MSTASTALSSIESLFDSASKNTLTLTTTYSYTDSNGTSHVVNFSPTLTITNDYPAVTVNTVSSVQVWDGVQPMTMFQAGESSLEQLTIPLSGSGISQVQDALIIHTTLLYEDLNASLVEIRADFSQTALAVNKITLISPVSQTLYLATGSLNSTSSTSASLNAISAPSAPSNTSNSSSTTVQGQSSTSTYGMAATGASTGGGVSNSEQTSLSLVSTPLSSLTSSSSTSSSNATNSSYPNSTSSATSKSSGSLTIWIVGGLAVAGILALMAFHNKK
ncbi:MAG: hypothetical protein M1542_08485 [Thermotogae bacterium]|nr:hypothetical protein [Thermotogota bacterium]